MRAALPRIACAAVVLAACPAFAAQDPLDAAFLSARGAFDAGSRSRLAALAPKLKGYVLEPYVEYWQLFLRLPAAPAEDVRDFLSRYPGSALAEQMRADWLKVLARAGRWESFQAEYPAFSGDDPEVACFGLLSRWNREDASARADFKAYWNAPRELPEGCTVLARAMLKAGQLEPRDVWARFRRLIDAEQLGAAKRSMEYLPRGEAIEPQRLNTVIRAPARFLKGPQTKPVKAADRELVIAAITLTADDDPRTAAEFWSGRVREAFSTEDQKYVWLMLAVSGARRHVPEALGWFREAGDATLTDEQLAWRTRIALRTESWAEVKDSIARMSKAARNHPTWIYWYGRAERDLGSPLEAEGYFGRIAGEHHFYGRLAAEELGIALRLPPRAPVPTDEEIDKAAAIPGLKRALALYRLEMRSDATREWLWTIRGMSDRRLLAAAELARRNHVWDRAIGTADRTVLSHDFSIRYLAPYREVLAQQARKRDLEEPWVLGVVRQESRFVSGARSSAGATGLMQVMRPTAKWVAERMRMRDFSPGRMHHPEMNAALGTYYLRHVLDQFDGIPVLAAAAYNAGPTRARVWRGNLPVEGAIFAETIPFSETRDYVKKVMTNTVYYAAVLGSEETPLKTRLGTVTPKNGQAAMLTKDEPAL